MSVTPSRATETNEYPVLPGLADSRPEEEMLMARIGALGDRVPDIHPEAWIAPGTVIVGRVTVRR